MTGAEAWDLLLCGLPVLAGGVVLVFALVKIYLQNRRLRVEFQLLRTVNHDLQTTADRSRDDATRYRQELKTLAKHTSELQADRNTKHRQLHRIVEAYRRQQREIEEFRQRAETLRRALIIAEQSPSARNDPEPEGLRTRLQEAHAEQDRVLRLLHEERQTVERLERTIAAFEEHVRELTSTTTRSVDAFTQAKSEWHATLYAEQTARNDAERRAQKLADGVAELEARLEAVGRLDCRLWERPLAWSATPFRPLASRKMPIIAVLNLKGGVGKTTITANLAATWHRQKRSVLTIDLDYQRSLSTLLLNDNRRETLHREERTVQHFLAGSKHTGADLLRCAYEVLRSTDNYSTLSLLTNSDVTNRQRETDSLEVTESSLMFRWAAQAMSGDVRLFLREALHDPVVAQTYDFALLDCPPRLTTACINALAASDYVLIPVLLDAMSARAVPNLLRSLRRLREQLLPNLKVLGIVVNRTYYNEEGRYTKQERSSLETLQAITQRLWPEERIPFFISTIPDRAAIGEASRSIELGELKFAIDEETGIIRDRFTALAAQIERPFAQSNGNSVLPVSVESLESRLQRAMALAIESFGVSEDERAALLAEAQRLTVPQLRELLQLIGITDAATTKAAFLRAIEYRLTIGERVDASVKV